MSQAKILIVEDEIEIRELIALHLEREGWQAQMVGSSEEAMQLIEGGSEYSVLILDWMLPGLSGVQLLKNLREFPATRITPILMITAKADASDIVQGLEAGADDYLTKPFEPSVLIARVRALIRRGEAVKAKPSEVAGEIKVGGLVLNEHTVEVKCMGEPIALTASEFKLLLALAQSQGRVLTRDSLIGQVQGEGVSVVGRTVDTHVFGLRKKLGACADILETVRGVGYRVKSGET